MKKLLRDAWQAIAGKKHDRAQRFPKKGFRLALHTEAALAEADVAFGEAVNAQQAGRLPEAQAAYRRILERLPTYAPALHFLGVTYGQAGDFVEAERLIRESIQIKEAPDSFVNLALALGQQGRREEAIDAQSNAVRLDPDNASLHRTLGELLVAAARYSEAEQAYRSALTLQPDDADTQFKLGFVLAELKRYSDAVDVYRVALSLRPAYPDAHNNLGNLFKSMRRHDEAENAYRQALLLQPDAVAVHCNLGQLLEEIGRPAEAEEIYRRALELDPDFSVLHNNLGNLYASAGRGAEAEAAYGTALKLQPDFADAHNNFGNLLMKMERHTEAEAAYRQALAHGAGHVQAWGNIGVLFANTGKYIEAEAAYRKALSLDPGNVFAHTNLANLLGKTHRSTEAEAVYRSALQLDPDNVEACGNLGTLLQAGGRIEEAEILLRRSVALKPDSALTQYNLGRLLLDTRRHEAAEKSFLQALAIQPDLADARESLGTVYKETGRYVDAEGAYRRALAIHPGSPGAHCNLGLLFQCMERFEEAEAAYREALILAPDNDFPIYNWALLCLSEKRFAEGWEGYERRWKMKDFNVLRHQAPQVQWRGEALAGETMLVWQEQGVGDVILYGGMIPNLLVKRVRLIVECEARLVPLLARSFPQAKVVMRSDIVHPATLEAHWQSPLGSLCRWLRTRVEDFTWRGPYLVPDADQVSVFKRRYSELGRGPIVGISWRSGNDKVGPRKSMSLAAWEPLLALGATFVNLQYGDCEEELLQLTRDTGITVHHDSSVDSLKNLDGFAAQVAAMDLVISTSNTTVHFAGALGVPVWTLLPKGGDALLWYWFNEGEDSLWYPSMRLFRQQRLGDWTGVIARVSGELREFLMKFE